MGFGKKKSGLSQVNAWIKSKSSTSSSASYDSRRGRESISSTGVGNLTNEFLDFLDETPSPWHVAAVCKTKLLKAGFIELKESEAWNIHAGMKFFFQREALTAAFVVGSNWKPGNAFSLAAGHIDSPGVRLKQISDKSAEVIFIYSLNLVSYWVLLGFYQNRPRNVWRWALAHLV